MSPQNQAAYLDGKAQPLRVASAPFPTPGPQDVIIKNHAVAINPVDWKIQDYAFMVQNWPTVLGEDTAGEIHSVGSDVTNLKVGDRVLHHSVALVKQDNEYGGFQLYTRGPAATTAKIPDSMSFRDAVVLPLAFDTAAVGIYAPASEGGLGLAKPSLETEPKLAEKTIVVWGGSSSVGAVAIQLAKQSGAKVVAVASKRNFEFCKKLGASAVVDYNEGEKVVGQVVEEVKQCGGEFVGVYDAISLPESYKYVLPILEKLGGGSLGTVLSPPEEKDISQGVKVKQIFGVSDETHSLWRDYIPQALAKGVLKTVPEPHTVGKGLESVQAGFDLNKKGVSAQKVVIEL